MKKDIYIQELKDVIRSLHKAEANHIESVPVRETFEGKTVWDGVVEVFELIGHPRATRVYAWAHDTDYPEQPRRHVTVLHNPPRFVSQGRSSGCHRTGV
jgi:hypothetical protein